MTTLIDARANAALAAVEQYLDIRAQFYGDRDDEGISGIYFRDVQAARETAVQALAELVGAE